MTPELFIVMLATFLLNLPFGWLRVTVPKFSFRWFLYIHLPIPFIVALRLTLGIGFKYVPILIALAILGQLVGGKARTFLVGELIGP